jgi:hypothetical protein
VNRRNAILGLAVALGLKAGFSHRAADLPIPPLPSPAAPTSLPPLPPSPVEGFRHLLDLEEPAQQRALAECPEPQRHLLAAKLLEYRLLPPDERALRLEATELRWFLRPLMLTPPPRRADLLAAVPGKYRAMIEDRLRQWDQISAATQSEILQNESAIGYVLRWRTGTPAEQDSARQEMTPARRETLDHELARWRALPAESRDRMSQQFQQFFELPGKQQQKTLQGFPEDERRQMETTLQAFARLPSEQRRLCVSSFRKFAELSPAERAQFLSSADRWKSLSPAERETWRKLVALLPPLPPGPNEPPLPPTAQRPSRLSPPLPPAASR